MRKIVRMTGRMCRLSAENARLHAEVDRWKVFATQYGIKVAE